MGDDLGKAIANLMSDKLEGKYTNVAEAKWIDVNERLPVNYMNCLVHYKHAYNNEDGYWAIGVSYYNGEKFLIDWIYQVTHWMPLPEPPSGAKKWAEVSKNDL